MPAGTLGTVTVTEPEVEAKSVARVAAGVLLDCAYSRMSFSVPFSFFTTDTSNVTWTLVPTVQTVPTLGDVMPVAEFASAIVKSALFQVCPFL